MHHNFHYLRLDLDVMRSVQHDKKESPQFMPSLKKLCRHLCPGVRIATTTLSWFPLASGYDDPYWFLPMQQPEGGPGCYHHMLKESRELDTSILERKDRGVVIRVIVGDGLSKSSREELWEEVKWLRWAQENYQDFHVFPVMTSRNADPDLLASLSLKHEITDCRDRDYMKLMRSVHGLTVLARTDPLKLYRVRSLRLPKSAESCP